MHACEKRRGERQRERALSCLLPARSPKSDRQRAQEFHACLAAPPLLPPRYSHVVSDLFLCTPHLCCIVSTCTCPTHILTTNHRQHSHLRFSLVLDTSSLSSSAPPKLLLSALSHVTRIDQVSPPTTTFSRSPSLESPALSDSALLSHISLASIKSSWLVSPLTTTTSSSFSSSETRV